MALQKGTIDHPKLGGLATHKALDDYDETDAVEARNTRFYKRYRPETRKGSAKYNSAQLAGAGNVTGLYDFHYGASGQKFIVCEDTKIYTDDGTTRTEIKSGMTAGHYYSFDSLDDFCWIVNGQDTTLKYDGTSVTNASIATPVVGTFAAAVGAAGVLTGTYLYLVTYYVSATGQESQPFTLASAPSASPASQRVDLSNIPISSDSQVTARRIYRTTAGGSIYNAQLLTMIGDNTTTTYEDNIADDNLGALINLDHDPMPILTKIVIYQGRAFGFTNNSSRLYFSKLFNVWYWPQGLIDLSEDARLFYIDIDPDDGDCLTNFVTYGGTNALILKNNRVYRLTGYDETDYDVDEIKTETRTGCSSKRGAVVVGGMCHFVDNNGWHVTNGYQIDYEIGAPIDGFFDPDNEDTNVKVNFGKLDEAVMETYATKPNNIIVCSLATGSENKNGMTIVMDYKTGQFAYDTGYYSQALAIKQVNNRDYLIRGDDYGYLWTEGSQYGDGGLISSIATGGSPTTLEDTTLSMTIDEYKGSYLEIVDGTGEGDRVLITGNTADTFNGTFPTTPDDTSEYTVGGIDFVYQHKWCDYGNPHLSKRLNAVRSRLDISGTYPASIYYFWDWQIEPFESAMMYIYGASLWDLALWDVGTFDDIGMSQNQLRPPSGHVHKWSSIRVSHKIPGQPIKWNGYSREFQWKQPR